MTIDQHIGIIGGNGWLGSAIARAAVTKSVLASEQVIMSGRSKQSSAADIPGTGWTIDNGELVGMSDVIVLSVRPEQFAGIDINASNKLVVSVMAGISARTISESTGADEVVRALPNAAASIGHSFTPWFASPGVTPGNKRLVQTLFAACGHAAEVPEEAHIDYCAGMTGTGAAFPALLAEALIAHAVEHGLPRSLAERAARSVVADASQLFAGPQDDTGEIVQTMIDYGGITAQALQAMRDQGFNEAVAAGLDASAAAMNK